MSAPTMNDATIDAAAIASALRRVRANAPLVHNITNYVVMNNTANALLAAGASPAMVHAVEEVEEFVGLAGALVVNIGTLSPAWVEAMHRAAARAHARGTPWVLDPVGVGATRYRTETSAALLAHRPTVVRGNASEILVLAGVDGAAGKGVDSAHDAGDALAPARRLAARTGGVVAVTGATDYVTDGARTVAIANGHPLMARVTAMGCAVSALTGACLAVETDAWKASAAALILMGVAGESAAAHARGPGSFAVEIIDTLYGLDRAAVIAQAKVT